MTLGCSKILDSLEGQMKEATLQLLMTPDTMQKKGEALALLTVRQPEHFALHP